MLKKRWTPPPDGSPLAGKTIFMIVGDRLTAGWIAAKLRDAGATVVYAKHEAKDPGMIDEIVPAGPDLVLNLSPGAAEERGIRAVRNLSQKIQKHAPGTLYAVSDDWKPWHPHIKELTEMGARCFYQKHTAKDIVSSIINMLSSDFLGGPKAGTPAR